MAGVAEAEVLEKSANLVLEVPFDLHEQSQADEEGFDRVAVEVFDADLPDHKSVSAVAEKALAPGRRSCLMVRAFRAHCHQGTFDETGKSAAPERKRTTTWPRPSFGPTRRLLRHYHQLTRFGKLATSYQLQVLPPFQFFDHTGKTRKWRGAQQRLQLRLQRGVAA